MEALIILILLLTVLFRFRNAEWLYPTQPITEPWRDVEGAFLVPLHVLQKIADPGNLAEIRRTEREYLDRLTWSLRVEGLHNPCRLVIDDRGKVGLQDGHHRILSAGDLEWTHLPITIRHSAQVRGYGKPVRDVFEDVARSIAK